MGILARGALLFQVETVKGCSANAHTVHTYCCKFNCDRLIKIILPSRLNQAAKLGKTMNIINTKPGLSNMTVSVLQSTATHV